MCKWELMEKYTSAVVYKRLLADLQTLRREGINATTKSGRHFNFRDSVTVFTSDNLSAHYLGGFRLSFSSSKICGFCYQEFWEMRETLTASEFRMSGLGSELREGQLVESSLPKVNRKRLSQ